MYGYRSPNPNGYTLFVLFLFSAFSLFARRESKDLAKASNIHPFFASNFCIFIRILYSLHYSVRTLAQASKAIAAPILGLYKNGLSQILHTIADFSLDTYIGNLSKTIQVCAGAVAIQRVTITVCPCYRNQCYKINFVLKDAHTSSSCLFSVLF